MGVGILSLPYALRLSGWAGIGLLLLLAVITSYTAMLLGKMLNYMPGMTSYPDVGQVSTRLGQSNQL
jgi:vesicular inhibitory amino acid transporter